MPQYRYTAFDQQGRTVRGTASAADPKALYALLRAEGLFLLSERASGRRPAPLTAERLAVFCQALGTLLASGVPAGRALALLAEETDADRPLRREYRALYAELQDGTPLADAMERRAPAFPALLVSAVRSAEGAGTLGDSILRMARHYEREHTMNQQVLGGLLYPTFLLFLCTAAVILLMALVVPQFRPLFAQLESLPLPTAILLGLSDGLYAHWPVILLLTASFCLVLRTLFSMSAVRLWFDRGLLCCPILGPCNRKLCTARFARTLADLYAVGIPLAAALAAGKETGSNSWITRQCGQAVDRLREGQPLSQALAGVEGFERGLCAAVRVGEETGRLAEMLDHTAAALDREAEQAARRLVTLLEPVLIVLVGCAVLFLIVAVILPIYESYDVFGL